MWDKIGLGLLIGSMVLTVAALFGTITVVILSELLEYIINKWS